MTNINEIKLSTGKWLMVEVPKESWNYELSNEKSMIRYWVNSLDETFTGYENLPTGHTYTLIGKASELIEDQWRNIIPEMKVGNRWPNKNGDYPIWFYSAKDSGFSLLKAHGLSADTTVVIKIH